MGVMDNGEHSGNRMTGTELTTGCVCSNVLEEKLEHKLLYSAVKMTDRSTVCAKKLNRH